MKGRRQLLDNGSHDRRAVPGRELAVCWRAGMLFVVTYSMLAVTVLLLKIITLLFKSLVAGVVFFCFALAFEKMLEGRNRSTIKMWTE